MRTLQILQTLQTLRIFHAGLLSGLLGVCFPLAADAPPGPVAAVSFAPVERLLAAAVADGAFPGCAAAVGRSSGLLWKGGFGSLDSDGHGAATPATLYDIASLTKVVGTTSVVLALLRDGKLGLDDPLGKHVPAFSSGAAERSAVKLRHLLVHASGLPAWEPLYRSVHGHEAVVAAAAALRLEGAPGTRERYSDLGFILLGEAAARAGGKPLGALEEELVFAPLGMRRTTRAVAPEDVSRAAPTERRPPVLPPPKGTSPEGGGGSHPAVRGVVHDENAAAAGGLTGHAGLFSTADDLALFARELLLARAGRSAWMPRALATEMMRRQGFVPGSSRALGWDTFTPGGSGGSRLSRAAVGHTGFTGTSMWIDPEQDLFIILLSNRVHPTRENGRIAKVRRDFADLVVLCLEGKVRDF